MIDFFGSQAEARRRTALLLCGFVLALALVVGIVYLALLVPVGMKAGAVGWWNGRLLLAVSAGVLGVTAVGAAWHAVALGADGGDAVARRLGGVPVARGSNDLAARRFLGVLDEMAIAAGLPVPRGYVMPDEKGINAFAAGATPGRSVVVVTRGALDLLSRDELQGVVAHELSHVLHADVRLNGRLLALVGGLAALSALGRLVWRAGWSARGRSAAQGRAVAVLAGSALAFAGWAGRLCGEVLRFAVVREREYLADAAAVQFTRNPAGLAGALRKVAAQGSLLAAPQAEAVSHFLFANGVVGVLETWFATHPPVEERIRRLGAGVLAVAPPSASSAEPPGPRHPARLPATRGEWESISTSTSTLAHSPGPAHIAAATAILLTLPPPLAAAAREPFGARGLACALLLGPPGPRREAQLARLGRESGPANAGEARRLVALADGLPGEARVVLLDLVLPALDGLSPAQTAALRADLAGLAVEAGHGPVLRWALHRALTRRLERRLADRAANPVRFRAVLQLEVECHAVLSLLAWAGARDLAAAQAALDAATAELGAGPWRILPRERLSGEGPGRALAALDLASPRVKERVLAACAAAAVRDGSVTADEAALLRAVAASLGCPVPPLVPATALAVAPTAAAAAAATSPASPAAPAAPAPPAGSAGSAG